MAKRLPTTHHKGKLVYSNAIAQQTVCVEVVLCDLTLLHKSDGTSSVGVPATYWFVRLCYLLVRAACLLVQTVDVYLLLTGSCGLDWYAYTYLYKYSSRDTWSASRTLSILRIRNW